MDASTQTPSVIRDEEKRGIQEFLQQTQKTTLYVGHITNDHGNAKKNIFEVYDFSFPELQITVSDQDMLLHVAQSLYDVSRITTVMVSVIGDPEVSSFQQSIEVLSRNRTLVDLRIRFIDAVRQKRLDLGFILFTQGSNLKRLELDGYFCNNTLTGLATGLLDNDRIEKLSLRLYDADDSGIQAIIDAVPRSRSLKTLKLGLLSPGQTITTWFPFAKLFRESRAFKKLKLIIANARSKECHVTLAREETLKSAVFTKGRDVQIEYLVSFRVSSEELEREYIPEHIWSSLLQQHWCVIGGFPGFSEFLSHGLCQPNCVNKLRIADVPMSSVQVEILCQSLKDQCPLSSLVLRNSVFSDHFVSEIITSLCENSTVTDLEIWSQDATKIEFNEQSQLALGCLVQRNQTMKSIRLILSDNQLSDNEDVPLVDIGFAHSLHQNKTLEHLEIHSLLAETPEFAQAMGESLKWNVALKDLALVDCFSKAEPALPLVRALGRNKDLLFCWIHLSSIADGQVITATMAKVLSAENYTLINWMDGGPYPTESHHHRAMGAYFKRNTSIVSKQFALASGWWLCLRGRSQLL